MKEFTYSYHSKRGKKVWISGHMDIGEYGIQTMIELNIVDNKSQVNWINDRRKGNDNMIQSLEFISNEELINSAIQFAEYQGYLKGIKEKYNK